MARDFMQDRSGLGCGNASVSAELYKLLVYDRDGFFLEHRDSEKTDGMFGTLVVTLPSTYRGGALRIRHAGREVTLRHLWSRWSGGRDGPCG
jgi:hypothetical protein